MKVIGLAEVADATTRTGEETVLPFCGEVIVTPANDTPANENVTMRRRTILPPARSCRRGAVDLLNNCKNFWIEDRDLHLICARLPPNSGSAPMVIYNSFSTRQIAEKSRQGILASY
jgi:hypothetical protein